MKENKLPHGGARKGAGRKAVDDKKVTISIYPRSSQVEAIGADRAREVALTAIEKEAKKYMKKYLENQKS